MSCLSKYFYLQNDEMSGLVFSNEFIFRKVSVNGGRGIMLSGLFPLCQDILIMWTALNFVYEDRF